MYHAKTIFGYKNLKGERRPGLDFRTTGVHYVVNLNSSADRFRLQQTIAGNSNNFAACAGVNENNSDYKS